MESSPVIVKVQVCLFIDTGHYACVSWLQPQPIKRRPRPTDSMIIWSKRYSISDFEWIRSLLVSHRIPIEAELAWAVPLCQGLFPAETALAVLRPVVQIRVAP